MKNRNRIWFFLLSGIAVFSCVKIDDLERSNPYDEHDGPNDAIFVLDSVSMIEESGTQDGLLQGLEKMYFQLWVKNTGTEPGRFGSWLFESEIDDALYAYPYENLSEVSGVDFVVDGWLEPGDRMRLESGQVTPTTQIPYSIRIEKGAMAGSSSILNMNLRLRNVHTQFYMDYPFPVNMF